MHSTTKHTKDAKIIHAVASCQAITHKVKPVLCKKQLFYFVIFVFFVVQLRF